MGIFKKPDEHVHSSSIDDMRHHVSSVRLPSHVRKVIDKELDMLTKIGWR